MEELLARFLQYMDSLNSGSVHTRAASKEIYASLSLFYRKRELRSCRMQIASSS